MSVRRRIALAVVVIVPLVGAAAWWWTERGHTATDGIEASGTVEATQAELGFQLSGRIEGLSVREGEAVEAGDLLGWLDRRETLARRESAEAAVEVVRARLQELERGARTQDVSRAEAALRAASEVSAERERELARSRRLHEGGAISLEALERAETAHALAVAAFDESREALDLVREGPRTEQIAGQRALLRQAEAQLEQVEVALSNAEIRAPFRGVVAIRHREVGESVGTGLPVFTLRDLGDRWVRIYVSGDAVGRVRLGQPAEIRGDAHPDRRYRGEVFFIGSEAEFTPRNVQTAEERTRLVYPVRVRIVDDPEVDLKPGLPVDVRLLEGEG